MIDERTMAAPTMPEGIYRVGRQTMRDVPRFKGFVREDGQPWLSEDDGDRYEVHDYVPRKCIVPPIDADEKTIDQMRRSAALAMTDFWHPDLGWLRCGTKRETEHPDNLGAGAVKYRRERVASPVVPDTALDVSAASDPDTDTAARRGSGRSRREEHSVA
jgi:hypothetical protein